MANFDQAEGLRRMLEVPQLRVLTFLSVLSENERNGTLINLSSTLAKQGRTTLMVDAKSTNASLGAWLNLKLDQTLLDVAKQQRTMDSVIKDVSPRLSITRVASVKSQSARLRQGADCELSTLARELSKVFDIAASKSDMVLVDCELNSDDTFLLSSFDDSEILVQLSADPTTIKSAYALIKRLNYRLGCRRFGIVVSGVNQAQAHLVFSNLSNTAKRYLAVELDLVGFVPEDIYLRRATELGRSVIDAFPLSLAANAFARMAETLLSTATLCSVQGRRESDFVMGAQFEI